MIRKGFSRGRGSLDPRICSIVRGLANQTIHTSENSSYNPSQATSHFVQPVPTFCNQLDTINVLDSSVIPYGTELTNGVHMYRNRFCKNRVKRLN